MATSGFFERLNHFANFERQFRAYKLLHFAVYAEFVAVAASVKDACHSMGYFAGLFKSEANNCARLISAIPASGGAPSLRSKRIAGIEAIPCTLATEIA